VCETRPASIPELKQRILQYIESTPNDMLKLLKANSPIPCRSAKGLDAPFPFDLHSAAVFDSHMPRRSESDFSRPRHSAAWAWHGMCELASAVQRRHVGDLPAFGFFRLQRGVPRTLLSEAYQSVKL
jgi:hypothetical protein